eukprot:Sspe_Gene.115638::Locus_103274_Transcript_1_1_Confidence_1.000_Length_507::g.115638::m.115638
MLPLAAVALLALVVSAEKTCTSYHFNEKGCSSAGCTFTPSTQMCTNSTPSPQSTTPPEPLDDTPPESPPEPPVTPPSTPDDGGMSKGVKIVIFFLTYAAALGGGIGGIKGARHFGYCKTGSVGEKLRDARRNLV